MALVAGVGVGVLVETLRAAAQASTPRTHEDKAPPAAHTAVAPRTSAALAGGVAAPALHGGCIPVVTGGGEEEEEEVRAERNGGGRDFRGGRGSQVRSAGWASTGSPVLPRSLGLTIATQVTNILLHILPHVLVGCVFDDITRSRVQLASHCQL